MNGRGRTSKQQAVAIIALLLHAAGLCVFAQAPDGPSSEMTELARKYQHGLGCPRDIGRALLYYRRAAELGNTHAMIALGDLYREGVCVERDLKYSTGMYRRAAEKGFAPAMVRLAEAAPREADDWLRRAAEARYGPALTRLGDRTGDAAWYRKAVSAQDPPAFAKLAATLSGDDAAGLLRRGADLGDAPAQALYARLIEEKDPARAAELYHAAAESGEPAAMDRWAYFAENGIGGTAKSAGEALVWYRKAAQAGEPHALFWMASRESDSALRHVYLKRASDQGYAPAMRALAEASGNQALLVTAAERGDTDAMLRLGGPWIEKAAAAGNVEALARLGRTEEAAARGHAASLLKLGRIDEAARAGDPEAQFRHGLSLADKADGTRWIERAAEAGHAAAMREMGLRYKNGSGAPVDPDRALAWLRRAAQAGDAQALFETGAVKESAEKGYGPAMVRLGIDTGDRSWFERAAAAGYANAWTRLGDLQRAAEAGDAEARLLLGDRAKKPSEALRLYMEAADAGYAPAMVRVGDCHMNGRGTSRSEIDAINWYRRAAQTGNAEALERLAKLGKGL